MEKSQRTSPRKLYAYLEETEYKRPLSKDEKRFELKRLREMEKTMESICRIMKGEMQNEHNNFV